MVIGVYRWDTTESPIVSDSKHSTTANHTKKSEFPTHAAISNKNKTLIIIYYNKARTLSNSKTDSKKTVQGMV